MTDTGSDTHGAQCLVRGANESVTDCTAFCPEVQDAVGAERRGSHHQAHNDPSHTPPLHASLGRQRGGRAESPSGPRTGGGAPFQEEPLCKHMDGSWIQPSR